MPRKRKKHIFFFHERHGFASATGTGAQLSKREKPRALGSVFSSGFFVNFFLSKPINMGSSFKDLDAKNPTMKTVRDLDTRFKR